MKIKKNKNYALITGASCGLGRSFANELASRGHNVLLISRPNEGLADLCDKIHTKYGVKTSFYEVDLSDKDEIDMLIAWIKAHFSIDILINNAGVGVACNFENSGTSRIDSMIQINMRAVSLLVYELLPQLELHKKSYILNVASMAAFFPIGYKSVYPATKSFIYSFSLGLSEELKDKNIQISVVNPGPMRTNASVTRRIESHGFFTKLGVVHTDIVAKVSINKMFRGKRSIIVGRINYLLWIFLSILPLRIKLPMVTRAMRKEVALEPVINL